MSDNFEYYKPFDLAMTIGRFHDFHNGHKHMINTARTKADRILILVGSSQEEGTERNPFDIYTRIQMIKEVFPFDSVIVKPLADLTNENDISHEWGKYLLKKTIQHMDKLPELMVYGNDDSRSGWFDKEDIKDITEIVVSRSKMNISATQMRRLLVENNRDEWFKYHDQKLHKHFDKLRNMLLKIDYYKKLASN